MYAVEIILYLLNVSCCYLSKPPSALVCLFLVAPQLLAPSLSTSLALYRISWPLYRPTLLTVPATFLNSLRRLDLADH